MVGVFGLISVHFAVYSSTTLVSLLLLGYSGVSQFFPGVVLGLYWSRVTTNAVFVGLVTGLAVVGYLILTSRDPFFGWNAGFLALGLNFLVTVVLALCTSRRINHRPVVEYEITGEPGGT